jgi:hypothetical protein
LVDYEFGVLSFQRTRPGDLPGLPASIVVGMSRVEVGVESGGGSRSRSFAALRMTKLKFQDDRVEIVARDDNSH